MSAAPITRDAHEAAHCIESFSAIVHGATGANGERVVIFAIMPPGERGWTLPLPVAEARRIAALLTAKADEIEADRG